MDVFPDASIQRMRQSSNGSAGRLTHFPQKGSAMIINTRIASVLAAKRRMKNLSQEQLAQKVGLDISTIVRIEEKPSLEQDAPIIRLLADELKLDYNYLVSLEEEEPLDIRMILPPGKRLSYEQKLMLRRAADVAFADLESDSSLDESDLYN